MQGNNLRCAIISWCKNEDSWMITKYLLVTLLVEASELYLLWLKVLKSFTYLDTSNNHTIPNFEAHGLQSNATLHCLMTLRLLWVHWCFHICLSLLQLFTHLLCCLKHLRVWVKDMGLWHTVCNTPVPHPYKLTVFIITTETCYKYNTSIFLQDDNGHYICQRDLYPKQNT